MEEAIRGRKHHDHRRNLLLNFLREGLNLDPVEFELEKKIKVHEIRGRIDAFFRHLIIEVKTDLDRERPDAEVELKKYFESQGNPNDFVGIVTDGLNFEIYIYDNKNIKLIRSFTIDSEDPLSAFQSLDHLFSTAKRVIPTPGDIVDRFGMYSTTFNAVRRAFHAMFAMVENDSAVAVKFREWNGLLSKVYGSEIGDKSLFITHTYLAMLSRAIVTMTLFPKAKRNNTMYRGIVNGIFFRQNRLVNLAEPDFFSWALDTPIEKSFLEDIGRIFACLDIYNFDHLEGDVLKGLYQGLVDPQSRHDLGEYYTPDWLAELTLMKIEYTGGRLLDPSCGSGSFLFAAARRLRNIAKLSKSKLVRAVIENIIGIDVHPVAVLMAKANLILSLKEEIANYPEEINLQIYMADTLMTGEDKSKSALMISISEKDEAFHIPFETVDRGAVTLDTLIDRLCDFAKRGVESPEKEEKAYTGLRNYLESNNYSNDEIFYWQHNFRLLVKLEKQKRNTVWAYILKNAYRPAFIRHNKVDYIVGNPPWLSYRYINNAAYKKRVKELTFDYGLLEKTNRNLFTQMDTSTVFFAHCQQDFLKPGGIIALVMPKTTVLPAKQHLRFQHRGFSQILDLSNVSPLFNVPSCVLIRGEDPTTSEIRSIEYYGDLKSERNLALAQASRILRKEETVTQLILEEAEYSPYHARFFQGATLVPRCLWFVEPVDPSMVNPEQPYLRTSRDAYASAKKPWVIEVDGQIEKEYLYGTVLAKHLLPFAIKQLSLIILPVAIRNENILYMVNSEQALSDGYVHAHDWFKKAEAVWEENRKSDSFTIYQWLNYDNKLTNQPFDTPYYVLYNKSGTNISAALITPDESKMIFTLKINGFVADMVCYWYATKSEEEAHYLVGILNSEFVNDAIKPLQTKGLQGERDIHRRPFEALNIPVYDPDDLHHRSIVELAKECRLRLKPMVSDMNASVGMMRREARLRVRDLLAKIDSEVSQLFKTHKLIKRKKKKDTDQGGLFE